MLRDIISDESLWRSRPGSFQRPLMHLTLRTPKSPRLFVEKKFSLLFTKNESLDLGLDAPEVEMCAGKP